MKDTRLFLYTILHGNLNFSSIPVSQYSKVIDQCYWPILEIIEMGFPVTIEFPAETLETIQSIDQSFFKKVKYLWEHNKCELLASTYSQAILPLFPYELNVSNISLAQEFYLSEFGKIPDVFFVPEQTFSTGILRLIREMGYKTVVVDWDNISKYQQFPPEIRYSPVHLTLADGENIQLIWNSSMNSFRFQRYLYSRTGLNDFIKGVLEHIHSDAQRVMCLYGTDWEIFNYRPLTQEVVSGETERVKTLFKELNKYPQIRLSTVSDVLTSVDIRQINTIQSSEDPIPCKNRDDYNVVRWAVSGRDDGFHNAKCYSMAKLKPLVESHLSMNALEKKKLQTAMVKLCGSDYRTKTTDEKHHSFYQQSGYVMEKFQGCLQVIIAEKMNRHVKMAIFNPYESDFCDGVVEGNLKFNPGSVKGLFQLVQDGKTLPTQFEHMEYYRDGSIRSVKIICRTSIEAGKTASLQLEPCDHLQAPPHTLKINGPELTVETQRIRLGLNSQSGGDMRSLIFKNQGEAPFIKYLPPVYFDNIGYSNDYFSGWSQLQLKDNQLFNDTINSKFIPDQHLSVIRIKSEFIIPFYQGWISKTFYTYFDEDRIDYKIRWYHPLWSPLFFRTGIFTLNPEFFDPGSLYYATVNGGKHVEQFSLAQTEVSHTRSPAPHCSASSCLGATEGWTAIGDRDKGLVFCMHRKHLFASPMIEFQNINQTYLLRIFHSLAESDDTGLMQFQGINEFSLSVMSCQSEIQHERQKYLQLNREPLIIQNHDG